MKPVQYHLERLRLVKRKKQHPLIHKIHKAHKISHKTLFYIKEYGPNANVPRTIIKESITLLLLLSLISSLGGLSLEHIKSTLLPIFPLIILLPALNDMIGNYGTIISSHFSTLLHEGRVTRRWWLNKELNKLFTQVLVISLLTAVLSAFLALAVSLILHHAAGLTLLFKVVLIAVTDVVLLVSLLFLVAIYAGFYVYRKGEDPNNFLIPITTSLADLGNMALFSFLVLTLF